MFTSLGTILQQRCVTLTFMFDNLYIFSLTAARIPGFHAGEDGQGDAWSCPGGGNRGLDTANVSTQSSRLLINR